MSLGLPVASHTAFPIPAFKTWFILCFLKRSSFSVLALSMDLIIVPVSIGMGWLCSVDVSQAVWLPGTW